MSNGKVRRVRVKWYCGHRRKGVLGVAACVSTRWLEYVYLWSSIRKLPLRGQLGICSAGKSRSNDPKTAVVDRPDGIAVEFDHPGAAVACIRAGLAAVVDAVNRLRDRLGRGAVAEAFPC